MLFTCENELDRQVTVTNRRNQSIMGKCTLQMKTKSMLVNGILAKISIPLSCHSDLHPLLSLRYADNKSRNHYSRIIIIVVVIACWRARVHVCVKVVNQSGESRKPRCIFAVILRDEGRGERREPPFKRRRKKEIQSGKWSMIEDSSSPERPRENTSHLFVIPLCSSKKHLPFRAPLLKIFSFYC